ncbi:HIT family protein [Micromonospora sp. DT233]|uniref:HIT family protein n=1 Tax=Micromonospora sp. DT233 TaxID=3393432 RepID=UPI003CECB2F3
MRRPDAPADRPERGESGCVFCAIVARTQPTAVVYEDGSTLAFLDITAVTPGHTLVVPKTHRADLWEIAPDEWAAVTRTVHRVARRIEEVLRPDGMTLFQANRDAGWQDVFHLHVHVVPRATGDHLHRPWTASPVPLDTLQAIRARLFMPTPAH